VKPRIAVMLASPPGFNPGMIATELALDAFLARHGWQHVAQRYRLISLAQRLRDRPDELLAIERRGYSDAGSLSAVDHYDAFASSDVVLYWADFLHLAQYLRALRRVAAAHLASSRGPAEVARLVDRLFLLSEADDAVLRRTISFGTNLLFNTSHDEGEAAYGVPLRRLMTLMRRVWVRDALSAGRVAHLRRDYRHGFFGVDCALLLRREDLAPDSLPDAHEAGGVIAFFGRDREVAGPMTALATSLAASLERPLRWLPWGDANAFPALGAPIAPLVLSNSASAQQLLRAVAQATLVVTDTYHLAAIAWSFGVPAVAAFGAPAGGAPDVSAGPEFNRRDKREVFFSQYDALEFLVRPEELAQSGRYELRRTRLMEVVRDATLCGAIAANVRAHADAIEADLAAEITEMLAP
jgi:hypothetical protein